MAEKLITETFYLTHDNSVDLLLKADGDAVDLTPVTRVKVQDVRGAWSVDSSVTPAAFDWDSRGDDGVLILKFGGRPIPPKTYVCRIIIYDPVTPNGIVWGRVSLVFEQTVV